MLSGRITRPDDWHRALRAILDAPQLEASVLTVISDTLTGSIGIRGGRFLTGAHTSAGRNGVDALRQLIAVERGFYSYLDANQVKDSQSIDQGLNVDIAILINAQAPAAAGSEQPAESAADEATAELRKTFQALRPVTGQSRVPPPPSEGVVPQGAPKKNPAAVGPIGSIVNATKKTYIRLANLSRIRDNSQSETAVAVEGAGDDSASEFIPPDRKRTNPLDKLIYGAASTCMKLTALSMRQPSPLPPGIPPIPSYPPGNTAPPADSGENQPAYEVSWSYQVPGTDQRVTPPEWIVPAFEDGKSGEARNPLDAVRATAWKIASRVAQAAKMRMESDERLSDNRRLRSIESDTAEETEEVKAKRKRWPPDAATVALSIISVLGVCVLLGAIWIGYELTGGRPYFSVGKKYMASGQDELAIGQFTLALEKDANDADALQARAEAYEKIKDYQHAAADYSRLSELRPKAHAAARKAAFYQFKLRKYDDSIKACRKILAAQADDESAKAMLAMSLSRSGKYQEALDAGSRIDNDLVPSYLVADFLSSMGYAASSAGDDRKAIAFYARALKADPTNESSLAERAATFMQFRQYKNAAKDYASLTKLYPARAGGYAELAKASYLAGDYSFAAEQYEKAIKFAPSVEFYLRLADCHMAMKKFGYVVSDCDSALTLQPTSYEASHLRAVAMQRAKAEKAIVTATLPPDPVMKRIATAGDALRRGFADAGDPMTAQGYRFLVDGNPGKAVTILSEAVKRTPGDNSARRFLANALIEMKRTQEAFEQFSVLAANNALLPSDELAYAKAAQQCGREERAIEIYIKSLDRDPTFIQARVNLIRLCVQKGYADKAAEVAAEGIALSPTNKAIYKKALEAQ